MKWIFIYGPPRTGSTYLLRLIREVCNCSVSDWGLGAILKPFVETVGGIDKERFLQDLAKNLIDSSKIRNNQEIDLVIKSANGNTEEFRCYQKMFCEPMRIIFTIREPSSYMASATKKFPDSELESLQTCYERMLDIYSEIGGDIFNYHANLTTQEYLDFLKPLDLNKGKIEDFNYNGIKADHLTTAQMITKYHSFLSRNATTKLY